MLGQQDIQLTLAHPYHVRKYQKTRMFLAMLGNIRNQFQHHLVESLTLWCIVIYKVFVLGADDW